jgi:hypothetical protein
VIADARAARDANISWGYWREWLFVLGTLAFAAGLLTLGAAASGAQRWLLLAMVLILVFSVYVAGTAWLSSAKVDVESATRRSDFRSRSSYVPAER